MSRIARQQASARAPVSAQARPRYRRDRMTWVAFGALFAFGLLNAILGPALPYLRAVEHLSYLGGAMHQAAYALGGGLAGVLAAGDRFPWSRPRTIAGGLAAAGVTSVAIGYGTTAAVTVTAAGLVSFFATTALIGLWAALADIHGSLRAVALTEGEVSVSLAGIFTPLVVGALAATALGWSFAFVIAALISLAATLSVAIVGMPAAPDEPAEQHEAWWRAPRPTHVLIFAVVALEFTLSFWLASYLNDDVGIERDQAVTLVSCLYAANLAGRVLASRLARHASAQRVLAGALLVVFTGLPVLVAATSAAAAVAGIALVGAGIGATFPLASALHVEATPHGADSALGQTLAVAALGQIAGPLSAAAIAQAIDLRAGLLVLPILTLLAGAALAVQGRSASAA